MKKKVKNGVKLIITIAIICAFAWFLIIGPTITFHDNEKQLENAARRYFDLNPNELPTGQRVKTVSLKTLYHKAFLENDFKVPYSNKTCSVENSWVKVRRENNEFKYYTYLDCGILKSNVDHEGPVIKLNGREEMNIDLGRDYKEAGVKSIIDQVDGKLKIEDVTIKGTVDTTQTGSYEVKYIAFDSLSNKTTVTRKINVVQRLNQTVKDVLDGGDHFIGDADNNYIMLSKMLFRIIGLDKNDDEVVVADTDVANENHNKIEKWLDDYYYKHLNEETRKMIVKKKYCNGTLTDTTLDTLECSGYTSEKKNVFIPSVIDVNRAQSEEGNFMKPSTMSWVANKKSDKEAYLTREFFVTSDSSFQSYSVNYNYGVRPMFTIKGDIYISRGIGTEETPFIANDYTKAKGGDLLNTGKTGEYVSDGGMLWRIIDVMEDGTTKVIANQTLRFDDEEITCTANANSDIIKYNPKDKNSIAYFINNKATEYVDTSNFAYHTIKVPIYKNKIVYGNENETKEYKVVLSAPNMYEMFSSYVTNNVESDSYSMSYWLLNVSKEKRMIGVITDIGVPLNDFVEYNYDFGIRPVAYFKKNIVISSGEGTLLQPYIIK